MAELIIGGLQKTTMIDFPGKIACTVFTKGCNLRCPYCHNSRLILEKNKEEEILEEEILAFLKKRKDVLEGVCISGGEPLIQNGLLDFIVKIKEMGYLVKLDSNGFFPIKLKELISKGLIDYLAMDIKNSPDHYGKATGTKEVDIRSVNESVEILKENKIPFEFRTTAVKGIHDISDFISIAKWLRGPYLYYIQNYRKEEDTIAFKSKTYKNLASFTKEELEDFLRIVRKKLPNAQIRSV